jgi:hypothetical protein
MAFALFKGTCGRSISPIRTRSFSDRVLLHNPQSKPPLYPVHGVGQLLRVQHCDQLGDRFIRVTRACFQMVSDNQANLTERAVDQFLIGHGSFANSSP